MLIISHRGDCRETPENTLAAFERAVQIGVDGIETDLRLCRDGELILCHDRVAPNGVRVADLSRAELESAIGHEVPTAEEAIASWKQLLWILEIKAPEALRGVLKLVHRYRRSHRFLVTSFWHPTVEKARAAGADCGFNLGHRPEGLVAPTEAGVHTLVWNHEFLDDELVAESRALGYKNVAYGVRSPADHQECVAWGLNAIITDDAEYAVALRDRLPPSPAPPLGRNRQR